jgi:dihydrofolate reductase
VERYPPGRTIRRRRVEPPRRAPTLRQNSNTTCPSEGANQGGDVHLVGGPRTIETYRALGALDELQLVVLPVLFGGGMQLTPSVSPDAGLTFVRERALPGGSVEIVYACRGPRVPLPGQPDSIRAPRA